MRKASLGTVLIFILSISQAIAGTSGGSNKVFTLSENLDVEPTTGTSSLNIPIEVPQGRAGIQPNIALLYNSSGSNSLLGMGWNMELGNIQRSTRKGIPRYNNTDTFVIVQAGSQQELVDISGNGTEFRPELEGSFSKIKFDGTSWIVTDTKGTKYYFGTSAATRVTDPSNTSRIFRWCLEKVQDLNGNFMTVTYVRSDNQLFPTLIDYTGNSQISLPTYAQVRFNYEQRTVTADFSVNYNAGFPIALFRRVKSIESYVGTNLVRRYQMNYAAETETGRSLLQGVTLIGSDGVSTLPSTVLTYSQGQTALDAAVAVAGVPAGYDLGTSKIMRMLDMNSDGKPDLLKTSSNLYNIYYNTSSGANVSFGAPVLAQNSPTWGAENVDVRFVDFNGDGFLDIVFGQMTGYTIWINNGVSGFNPPVNATNFPAKKISDQNLVQFMDMNGDAKSDIVVSSATAGAAWQIYFNTTGSDFAAPVTAQNSPAKGTNNATVQFGDFNGDGLNDAVLGELPNYKIWTNNGVNGFNAPVTVTNNPPLAISDTQVQLADMNGDGLTDIVRTFAGSSSAYYIYYNNGQVNFNPYLETATHPNYGTPNTNVKFMDMNGDNQIDVIMGDPVNSIPYKVWLNDGFSGFKAPLFLGNGPSVNLDNENVVLVDLNGDGRMDILQGLSGNYQAWLNKRDSRCAKIATLIDVDNSVGGHLELRYQHLPIKNLSGNSYKVAISPFMFNSVKTISRRASLNGDLYVTTYSYQGGLWDNINREFRGFKTVKIIDADGNYAVSDFSQDDIFKGRPLSQASYDKLGNLYSKSVNTWSNQLIYAGVNFPFLKQTDSYIYDGNATGRRVQQQFFYGDTPQMGLLTKTISLGEVDLVTGVDIGTDATTTEVQYNNNTTAYLYGLPKITTIKNQSQSIFAKTTFYYDSSLDANAIPVKGFLTKKVDWAGNAVGTVHPFTLYTYNSIGNLLTTEDSKASRTTVTYDTTYQMFPLTTTNALGHVVTNEYYGINGVALSGGDGTSGVWGQLKSTTDPNQQKGLRIYDTFGRMAKAVSPQDTIALPTTSYEYVYGAAQLKMISHQRIQAGASGTIDNVQFYDGLGRLVQSKSKSETPGNFVVGGQTEYSSRGLPIKKYTSYFTSVPLSELDPIDSTQPFTLITYDAMGRVLRTTAPNGSFANVTYDDWASTSVDENGHMQKSYSDSSGRLIKKEEYLGSDGRNANYPAATYQLYATTLYTYDVKGNLIKTQDAKGNITTIAYDTMGRKISMTDPDMGTWTYGYDVEGSLIWQQDAKGQRVNFSYDTIGRLKQKTDLSVLTVDYTYDDPTVSYSKGRLTKAAYSGGKAEFKYDNIGRELQSIKTIGSSAYQVSRTYDAVDRLVTLQYPDNSKVGYTYNEAGLVNSVFQVLPATIMPTPGGTDGVYLSSPAVQYRLNENSSSTTITDTGTVKVNATSSVATSLLSKPGKLVNAFMFNGSSTYVNTDALLNKIRTDSKGTFSFWVKPQTGSSLFTFAGPGGYFSLEWYELNQSLTLAISGSGTPISCTTPTGSLPLGAWSHVVVVQDGVNAKIYINGQEQALYYWFQSNKAAWFSFLGSNVTNGRIAAANTTTTPTSNNGFFQGSMDDVRYYSNKALIPQEVWALYSSGFGTESENPLVTNNMPASVQTIPYMAAPFSQFKLNDNTTSTAVLDDTVGYNDGVSSVNTSLMSAAGKVNGALSFNGTNQSVDMASLFDDIRNDTVGTFSMWVKPVNANGSILSFAGSSGSFSIDWYKGNQSANLSISGAGTPISCTTQTNSIPANVYSHLVITQDGTQFKIYLNGVQQNITYWYNSNPGAWLKFLSGTINNARLGSTMYQGTEYYFQGGVDDLRYYKKSLNQTEVLALYNSGNGTEETNPALGTEPTPLPPLEPSTIPLTVGQTFVKNVDYNALGQIVKLEYGNGVITTYTYDPLSFRLSKLKSVNGAGIVIQDFSYIYDGVGNIMTITDAANTATQSFQYDELNRLRQAIGQSYGTKTYTYDQIGNILTKDGLTYTYSKVGAGPHAVTSLSNGTTITYDLNGNMIRKSCPGLIMEYFFDKENRLIEVRKNTTTVAQYIYDGDGGRVQKVSYVSTVNQTQGGLSFGPLSTTSSITTTPITTKYVGDLYEETGNAGTKSVFLGSQRVAGIDTATSAVTFFLGDHLGSTNVTTNTNGIVQEILEYAPFGEIKRHDASSSNGNLAKQQFTGKKLDDETGLYYYGARYYDSLLGKFITPDTIVQAPSNPQTLNRYAYCGNNPVNNVDPSGHSFWGSVKKFFGKWGQFVPVPFMPFGALNGSILKGAITGNWNTLKNQVISTASAFVCSGFNPIAAASAFATTTVLDSVPGQQLTRFVASEVMDDMLGMRPGSAQVWARVGLQVAGTLAVENVLKGAVADPATTAQYDSKNTVQKAIADKPRGYDPAGGRYPGGLGNNGFDLTNPDVQVLALTVKGQSNPTVLLGTGKFGFGTLVHTGAASSSFHGAGIERLAFGHDFLNGYATIFGVCHQATNATLLASGVSSTVWNLAPHWSTVASTITYGNYGGQLPNYVYTGVRTDRGDLK